MYSINFFAQTTFLSTSRGGLLKTMRLLLRPTNTVRREMTRYTQISKKKLGVKDVIFNSLITLFCLICLYTPNYWSNELAA